MYRVEGCRRQKGLKSRLALVSVGWRLTNCHTLLQCNNAGLRFDSHTTQVAPSFEAEEAGFLSTCQARLRTKRCIAGRRNSFLESRARKPLPDAVRTADKQATSLPFENPANRLFQAVHTSTCDMTLSVVVFRQRETRAKVGCCLPRARPVSVRPLSFASSAYLLTAATRFGFVKLYLLSASAYRPADLESRIRGRR